MEHKTTLCGGGGAALAFTDLSRQARMRQHVPAGIVAVWLTHCVGPTYGTTPSFRANSYCRVQAAKDHALSIDKQPVRRSRPHESHPSLNVGRPDLTSQWHPTKNGSFLPQDATLGSQFKAWWLCTCCPCGHHHVWQASIGSRALLGRGCPICSKHQPCKCTSLAAKDPETARKWHPTKNEGLTPSDVTSHSARRVWWICTDHPKPFEWTARIGSRTRQRGSGCPACNNKLGRKLIQHSTLAIDHKSLALQWHPTLNGTLTPGDVKSRSNKLVWWLCKESKCHHPHVWKARIDSRVQLNNGCPFCSGRQVCLCNSLATVRPDIAAQWHPHRNEITPQQCPPSSGKYVWWQHAVATDQIHEWRARVAKRTHMQGTGCPLCRRASSLTVAPASLRSKAQ